MMIDTRDLTVVLQGGTPQSAAGLQALDQRINTLRQVLPGVSVVLSTWERSPSQTGADLTVFSANPGSLPAYKLGPCKPNNVNRQIVSSAAGLAAVRTPFAMKLRNDALLLHGGALTELGRLKGANPQRIVTLSHFSVNPHRFERMPFHFSDWFQLGTTQSLCDLWSCPLMTLAQATHYDSQPWAAHSNVLERRFCARWPAEQHVWRHYAAKLGYRVPDFHNDITPAVLADHDRFLAQELLLLDLPQAGVQLPALAWAAASGMQRFNCINHLDWLAAATRCGLCTPDAAQQRQIKRRQRAQQVVQRSFQFARPLLPLLARPPLKIVCRWVLKGIHAWSRATETAPSLNPAPATPCSTS